MVQTFNVLIPALFGISWKLERRNNMKFLNLMLLRQVLFQMGLQKQTVVVGRNGFDMMRIIFPPSKKKKYVIVVSVRVAENPQESRERSIEIHVLLRVERNI